MRTRAERRKNTWKKIRRAENLEQDLEQTGVHVHYRLKVPHQYAKSRFYRKLFKKKALQSYEKIDPKDQRQLDDMKDQLDE